MSTQPRQLRMLFFLDYEQEEGTTFSNSPGLLPFIKYVRDAGFDLQLITTREDLMAQLDDAEIDVVGISSMQRLLPRSIHLAKEIRQQHSDVILMIGGNAIDPFAVDLAAGLLDVVVLGEAEHSLPALLRALARARGLEVTPHKYEELPIIAGPTEQVAETTARGALTRADVDELLQASFGREIDGYGGLCIRPGHVLIRDSSRGVVWRMDEPTVGDANRRPNRRVRPREDAPAAETGVVRGDAGNVTAPQGRDGTRPDRPRYDWAALPDDALRTAPLEAELDALFEIPWDLYEAGDWYRMELFTQRGCPWGRCKFCSLRNRERRAVSPETVCRVLTEAAARHVMKVSFADDCFVQDPAWNQALLEQLSTVSGSITYTAQTMATRAVWPLLEQMHEAGFCELSLGVETIDPDRAELMGKTANGRSYVKQAKKTVQRIVAAGMYPTLYMIMVDPTSTLLSVARELADIISWTGHLYIRKGILPKLSHSLVMLPIEGTPMTTEFPVKTEAIALDGRTLHFPTQYVFDKPIVTFLSRVALLTRDLQYPRENLAAFEAYLTSVAEVAEMIHDPALDKIRHYTARGLGHLQLLTRELDQDVEETLGLLIELLDGDPDEPTALDRFDFRRFGGYIKGIRHYREVINTKLENEMVEEMEDELDDDLEEFLL